MIKGNRLDAALVRTINLAAYKRYRQEYSKNSPPSCPSTRTFSTLQSDYHREQTECAGNFAQNYQRILLSQKPQPISDEQACAHHSMSFFYDTLSPIGGDLLTRNCAPQDSRAIKFVGHSMRFGVVVCPSIRLMSRLPARNPISINGCITVVRGGVRCAAKLRSSKPTSARSSGMRILWRRAICNRSSATRSFAAKIAVGRSGRNRNFVYTASASA